MNPCLLQRRVMTLAAALIAACAPLASGQFVWDGELAPMNDHTWHQEENWDRNLGTPGAFDDVTISTQLNGEPPLVHINEDAAAKTLMLDKEGINVYLNNAATLLVADDLTMTSTPQMGTSNFTHVSTGQMTVMGALRIGTAPVLAPRSGSGLFNLGGVIGPSVNATLETQRTFVGYEANPGDDGLPELNGVFHHWQGLHRVRENLHLGFLRDSWGEYVLGADGAAATLEVGGIVNVGLNGRGGFTQRGDSRHTIQGHLLIAEAAGSVGNYVLESGILTVPNLFIGRQGGFGSFLLQRAGEVDITTLVIGGPAGPADDEFSASNGTLKLRDLHVGTTGTLLLGAANIVQKPGL